jgi:hypothetical protein
MVAAVNTEGHIDDKDEEHDEWLNEGDEEERDGSSG